MNHIACPDCVGTGIALVCTGCGKLDIVCACERNTPQVSPCPTCSGRGYAEQQPIRGGTVPPVEGNPY